MANEGMLEELDMENILNFKYIIDSCKSEAYDPENKYSVAYTWGVGELSIIQTMVDEADLDQGWGTLG